MSTFYNEREWLNPHDSPSTGSVVAYDGEWVYNENGKEEKTRNMFIEFASCHDKCKIHKTTQDTVEEYINKVRKLYDHIGRYLCYLEDLPDSEKNIK